MTKEQEAVQKLKALKEFKQTYYTTWFKVDVKADEEMEDTVDAIFNLIIKQQKELRDKEKIIDLMAEMLEKFPKIYCSSHATRSKNEWKQYFEEKVEE